MIEMGSLILGSGVGLTLVKTASHFQKQNAFFTGGHIHQISRDTSCTDLQL